MRYLKKDFQNEQRDNGDKPGIEDPQSTDRAREGIFRILQTVVLSENANILTGFQRSTEDSSKNVEGRGVRGGIVLRRMDNHRCLNLKSFNDSEDLSHSH